jgi:DNA topoisomerase-1
MDNINLAEAMDLFQLPRTLGETAAGETIVANVGRFGPYVKYGSKYVSLKEDDPYTVTLERALEVIRLKQEADANRLILDFPDDGIQVLNGRYGPYITDKKKNAKIPKDRDPKTLTLEECKALLEAAPERGGRFGRFGRGKKAAAAPAAAPAETGNAAAKKKKSANGSAADQQSAPAKKAAKASTKPAAPAHPPHTAHAPASSTPAPRAAARAAAKKAASTSGSSPKATQPKAEAHGHKAAATAAKAKASAAKKDKSDKAPGSGKASASRPRGVK